MDVKPRKFMKLRDAHHREKAEDYVEMVQELVKEQGEARLTEVAKRFGVSDVTAHKIILRLQKEKLIASKPYRALFLTSKGKQLAIKSKSRHETVYRFLRKLGVPESIAQVDAEGIEHHVSPKTLSLFKRYLKKQAKMLILLFCLGIPVTLQASSTEPEEPDFAFITGGPYTQGKNVVQLIQANNLANTYSVGTIQRDLTSSLRTEWGFTDNLEADLIIALRSIWTKTAGVTTQQAGAGDTTLGLRYRFLREDFFPFTITFGPQVIIPTGDVEGGLSNGQFGIAWDLTLAREWNDLFFNYASLNYSTTPGVNDPTAGSTKEFVLHSLTWGIAPAFRVLEKDSSKGGHHDIHLFLEFGGTFSQSINAGTTIGNKVTNATYLASPGFRYGYLSKNEMLTEIGFAAPIGLTDQTPDWGIIFQMQWENVF